MMKHKRFALIAAPLAAVILGATTIVAFSAGSKLEKYSQNFEDNTKGWYDSVSREPSAYANYGLYAPFINSEQGHWHARAWGSGNTSSGDCVGSGSGSSASPPCSGSVTDWGTNFQAKAFPGEGFSTSLDIYLDTDWAGRHPDVRFDYSTALYDASGGFLQDYVFNAGTSPTSWPGGTGFVINASTNADRDSAYPENPCPSPSAAPNACRTPVTITASGWYRFVHAFSSSGGMLVVDFSIVNDANHSTVAHWTIQPGHSIKPAGSDPGVGGPVYGLFPNEEIIGLPIDNATLAVEG